jgi:DNA-binding NarL/FixJ family response regulator
MRVLIIEDDESFADILRESLEEDGEFSVSAILENEEQAIEYMDSGALADIDAVLLDLQLPRSRKDRTSTSSAGLNLACLLRSPYSFWGTVLVLTNSRLLSDGERALAAGCDGYMCKHARMDQIPQMVSQLKAGLRGEVMMIATEMRHVFMRGEISPKEACLMSLLSMGFSWEDIARRLGYKNPKAAANIADRIYDKILSPESRMQCDTDGVKKRQRALEVWRSRNRTGMLVP